MSSRPGKKNPPESTQRASKALPTKTAAPRVLGRWSTCIAVALVLAATGRIVSTYSELSLTYDEPGHFACGLEYVSKHVYTFEPQHPPLSRAMMAVLPYLNGARLRGTAVNRDAEGLDIIKNSRDPHRMIFLARLGILPCFWLACAIVYLWARRSFGGGIAVIAVALFTLTPPVLAHAGLATTDMALTANLLAAFFALLLWAEFPTWHHSLLFGLATALAVLSKFTAIGYLPAVAMFTALLYLAARRPLLQDVLIFARQRAIPFAVAFGSGAFVIWAAYRFSIGRVNAWNLTLPAPELFEGIRVAMQHNSTGDPCYLLGEASLKGWWYFFPVALAVKTPIPILLFVGLGLYVALGRLDRWAYLAPVGFSLGVLVPAMTSSVSLGVRHVLPLYAAFAIFGALGITRLMQLGGEGKWANGLIGILFVWTIGSGIAAHPDYLSFFNAFAGGEPENILVDSDLDWGQNYVQLSRRLRQVHADSFYSNSSLAFSMKDLYGFPTVKPIALGPDWEGWTAINITVAKHFIADPILKGSSASISPAIKKENPWWETTPPTERLGGVFLYYRPPKSAAVLTPRPSSHSPSRPRSSAPRHSAPHSPSPHPQTCIAKSAHRAPARSAVRARTTRTRTFSPSDPPPRHHAPPA